MDRGGEGVNCVEDKQIPSFLLPPSLLLFSPLPSFLLSFFLFSFLPSFLLSFLPSFLLPPSSFLPSFLLSILTPSFLLSCFTLPVSPDRMYHYSPSNSRHSSQLHLSLHTTESLKNWQPYNVAQPPLRAPIEREKQLQYAWKC
jgi:hypothetical protein